MADEELLEEEQGEDMGVVILMLSLYLIVLAFFILLNAISEDNKGKVDSAMQSVNEGFSFRTEGQNMYDDDTDEVRELVFDSVAEEVKGILETYLSLRDYTFRKKSKHMQIIMHPYSFFEPGKIAIKPVIAPFFDELSTILSKKREGIEMHVKVRVTSVDAELGGRTDMDTFELSGRRASLFVRTLLQRGLDAQYIAASAGNKDGGTAGIIEIDFNAIDVGLDSEFDDVMRYVTRVKGK